MLLGYLARKFHYLRDRQSVCADVSDTDDTGIHTSLQENLRALRDMLGDSSDLKQHSLRFGAGESLSGALVYIDGLADNAALTDALLRPLTQWRGKLSSGEDCLNTLSEQVLCGGDIRRVRSLPDAMAGCLSGDTAVLVDGFAGALIVSTKGWEKRGITEPQSETVVRGPREGFTENLRTNTAMIRRKIKHGKLRVESMTVGHRTRTEVCLMYIDGIASARVLEEVRYRIMQLDVDAILESGYIEEYIEDAPFSPFATVGYTEKPDVAAARMLEGRIAIVVDGTPFVLTAPMLLIESFQTTEDYYARPLYASMIRVLRFIAYFITVFGPAFYIALTGFHQELIPTTLLFTIANAREGTPFPVFVETLIMVFAFEILYEAGIRMPRPVGQAISIVGALVMGEAAVSAGLVGAPMVITIAITAVAGFLVPAQNESASLLRLFMMMVASFAGWYGISMGFLALLMHLGSLNSFGVPYFDGFAWSSNLQDSFIRMPLWLMVRRPKEIAQGDLVRTRSFIPPLRPFAHRDADSEEGGQT